MLFWCAGNIKRSHSYSTALYSFQNGIPKEEQSSVIWACPDLLPVDTSLFVRCLLESQAPEEVCRKIRGNVDSFKELLYSSVCFPAFCTILGKGQGSSSLASIHMARRKGNKVEIWCLLPTMLLHHRKYTVNYFGPTQFCLLFLKVGQPELENDYI